MRAPRRIAMGTALAATLALAAPAAAATIDVTTTGDPGPAGTVSLRQAIAASAPGGTIALPAGTYVLAAGALAIDRSLTIAGAGAASTTVSGGGASRVFALAGAGAVELSGLTITGGRVLVAGGIQSGGGVLADQSSPLTLRSARVTGNEVDVSGTAGPGGIAAGGGIATRSDLTLIGTVVSGNSVTARGAPAKPGGIVKGGGIAGEGDGTTTVTLTDSLVDDNTADVTGGGGASGGIVDGGGIFTSLAPLTLTRSAVTRSQVIARATGAGVGGIADGGGVSAGGALTLTNVTISGNLSDAGSEANGGIARGGGVDASGDLTAVNVTVADNRALAPGASAGIAEGGNVNASDTTQVTNSIVAGGVAAAGKENCTSALTSGGHNLESADQCGFHATGDLVSKDPLLGTLQDNGGGSLTHALAAQSPAIDAAGAAACPATDQRGVARPQGAGCDIGSFEFTPPAPPPAPPPVQPPAAQPPPAPKLPPLFGSRGVVAGAPSARRCLSRRSFTIRIRKLAGLTISSATVTVNGKRVAVRSGKRLTAPVNLRRLPKGRYSVRIVVKLADGRKLSGTRRYRTCAPKRKNGRRIAL